MHIRKQTYSLALDPRLIEATDKAVKHFGFKSRSAFITEAIERYLIDLHKEIKGENK